MEQIDRAVRIVQNPQAELNKVKSEKISKEYLIKQYIAILAIIPAVAYIIGWGFIGMGWFGRSIEAAVVGGILTYILSIAGFYVTGLVINALAPNFTSKQNEIQAMKLAAYSYTPMLLGGIFNIIPALGIIGLLFALYGLYILYLGIPVLMETPADKALTYTIVIIVAMMVIYLVMGSIIAAITISMSPVPGMMGVIPQ
ncbi:MAG: YIP1 family protein [Euryarchaeota archaeon]|nr:YIP1 family protein [Euryarchaeota archaeon]MBU4220092.1 YIP1 family protein [Euryarchaeota archaeon]MCG2735464.1 YIP1 family protein [Candidatus Methanoperedenaceae archaeon]